MPCGSVCPLQALRDTAYLDAEEHGDTITIDLADGSWRRSGDIKLSYDDDDEGSDWHSGVPGNEVQVFRDGAEIYGVDTESGDRLWEYTPEGTAERPPGILVGHGAVVVRTYPDSSNPFASNEGILETVLDARTGEETGQAVVTSDLHWTTIPVAPGRAIVLAEGQLWPIGRET